MSSLLLSCALPQSASAHRASEGDVFDNIGSSIASLFGSAQAHGRSHLRHIRHRSRHHASPHPVAAPGFGVPEGTIGSHALVADGTDLPLKEWDGQIATLQSNTHASKPVWLAVLLDGAQLAQACSAGWVHSIDDNSTCGLPGGVSDIALTWDRSRLAHAPTWQDFWDVARHPGRRGLRFGARTTLEIALLADGVALQDIYPALSSQQGVDRAFRKLDLLRPYIIWWHTPEDAARIMESSSALMLSAPNREVSSVSAQVKDGAANSIFVAGSQQVLRTPLFWAIPANVSDTVAKGVLATIRMHGPHLTDMPEPIPPAPSPTILTVSDTFWATHGAALEQQFAAHFATPTP